MARRRARFRAAVLARREGAALSHFAAAVFWGFWTWEERRIDVTIIGSGARQIAGVRVHRSRALDERDVLRRDGLRVTTPARTLLGLLDAGGIERPEINARLRFGTQTIVPGYLWLAQRRDRCR